HWLADETVRLTGAARPTVARMPIDTSALTPGSGPRNGVLFVGKLDRQKGLRVLLEAFAQTDRKSGQLSVVGDGSDREHLHAYAASVGLGDRVRWLGTLPQAELVHLYRAAAVVVLPATEPEGLGLVAVEAQLCG